MSDWRKRPEIDMWWHWALVLFVLKAEESKGRGHKIDVDKEGTGTTGSDGQCRRFSDQE